MILHDIFRDYVANRCDCYRIKILILHQKEELGFYYPQQMR